MQRDADPFGEEMESIRPGTVPDSAGTNETNGNPSWYGRIQWGKRSWSNGKGGGFHEIINMEM